MLQRRGDSGVPGYLQGSNAWTRATKAARIGPYETITLNLERMSNIRRGFMAHHASASSSRAVNQRLWRRGAMLEVLFLATKDRAISGFVVTSGK